MTSRITTQSCRDLIPSEIVVPCEKTDTAVSVQIWVDQYTGRVWAPGLRDLQSVLSHGAVSLVEDYCMMWTRWLTRAETKPMVRA